MEKEKKEIQFRKANESDLEDIFNMIKLAIQDMRNKNIDHWDETYPDKNVLLQDINKKELYIGFINDEIVSIIVINDECYEEYNTGKWEGRNLTYKILHRLCVNPLFQNKQIRYSNS